MFLFYVAAKQTYLYRSVSTRDRMIINLEISFLEDHFKDDYLDKYRYFDDFERTVKTDYRMYLIKTGYLIWK